MEKKGAFYTYTYGPDMSTESPVTTRSIVKIIDSLHAQFGEEYEFVPEPITEGGILFTKWPGKKDGQYKTFRFNFSHTSGKWPWVERNGQVESWRNSREEVIWSPPRRDAGIKRKKEDQKLKGTTYLKAFYGAPVWTMAELKMFQVALESVGIAIRKFPSVKRLKHPGEI